MCTNPQFLTSVGFPVPCGRCFECCNAYSNMWAQRCSDEASLYKENCIITLTYEKTDGDLHKEHLQKFIKRLRKEVYPRLIRYYGCGEYGGKGNRPHYHLIVFNWFPSDAKLINPRKRYFGSKQVEKIWKGGLKDESIETQNSQRGYILVGEMSFESARYCCKYLQKMDEREHRVKPFTIMSRRPGIGAHAVDPEMLLNGVTYYNGKTYPIPRFYLDKLEQNGYNVDVLKAKRRYIMNAKGATNFDLSAVDSARRRGELQKYRLKKM